MLKDVSVVYLRLLPLNLPGALGRNPRRLLVQARDTGRDINFEPSQNTEEGVTVSVATCGRERRNRKP
jgi:hypothetical protein